MAGANYGWFELWLVQTMACSSFGWFKISRVQNMAGSHYGWFKLGLLQTVAASNYWFWPTSRLAQCIDIRYMLNEHRHLDRILMYHAIYMEASMFQIRRCGDGNPAYEFNSKVLRDEVKLSNLKKKCQQF